MILLAPSVLRAVTSEALEYDDIGMDAYRKGLYTKAVEYFQKAVEADPTDWQAYQEMGDAYSKSGDKEDALDAYEKSLKLHPDNPSLRVRVAELKGGETTTLDNGPAEETVIVKRRRRRPIFERPEPLVFNDNLNPICHARMWGKAEIGYNYSSQTGFMDSAKSINDQIAANGWSGSAAAGNNGWEAGGEIGFLINPYNGIALGGRYLRGDDYTVNVNFQPGTPNPDYLDEVFENTLIPLTVDYFLFMPDQTGRFYISAGLGYYAGALRVNEDYSFTNSGGGADTLEGDLTAGNIGFQVGIGREWALSPRMGISLFARGRYAKISHYRGTVYNSSGGSGTFVLVKDSNGIVDIDQPANMTANGETYAEVDFSGFDVGLALTFYTF